MAKQQMYIGLICKETGDGSLSPLRLSSAGKSVIIEDG